MTLEVLIGSSGDAETQAVEEAAQAWAEESGNEVEVIVANDLAQQLSQGFAGGNPPDLFYVDAGVFGDYAEAGNLYPYLDQMADADDFYPNLVDSFTLDGEAYCAPKDFSTLALQINTESWKKAGLTDADIPTTWDELQSVAQELTTPDQAGLVLGIGRDRVGAFLVQNGGFWVDGESGEATATEPTNVEALEYVQGMLEGGEAVLAPDVDAGWGGEAFGTQKAAMTIEGNWIRGAMENDYPDVEYTVAELPGGPGRQGHPALHAVLGHRRRLGEPGGGRLLRRGADDPRAAAHQRRRVRRHAEPRGRPGRLRRAVPRGRPVHRRW